MPGERVGEADHIAPIQLFPNGLMALSEASVIIYSLFSFSGFPVRNGGRCIVYVVSRLLMP